MPVSNSNINIAEAFVRRPQGQGSTLLDYPPEFSEHFRTHFNIASGTPAASAGYVPDPENFSRDTMTEGYFKIQALPIKGYNEDHYRVPLEVDELYGKTIDRMFQNQFDRDSLAYHYKAAVLYVDRSYVDVNQFQRTPGWHLDSADIAGRGLHPFIRPSTQISAQICVVSDRVTTQVQSKPARNVEIFSRITGDPERPVREGLVRNLEPYEIGLLDGDTWHRGRRAETAGLRNFVGVMFIAGEPMEPLVQSGHFERRKPETLDFEG